MKLIAAILGVALITLAPARAQQLKWASTNALPDVFTNTGTVVTSAADGAGGSVWLVDSIPHWVSLRIPPQNDDLIFHDVNLGFPTNGNFLSFFAQAHRVIWFDKSGAMILNEDLTTTSTGGGVSIVRVTRNDLVLQVRGLSGKALLGPSPVLVPGNAHEITLSGLRRYVRSSTNVTRTDTFLSPNESFDTQATANSPTAVGSDRTGLFSYELNGPVEIQLGYLNPIYAPVKPELVVRRYEIR